MASTPANTEVRPEGQMVGCRGDLSQGGKLESRQQALLRVSHAYSSLLVWAAMASDPRLAQYCQSARVVKGVDLRSTAENADANTEVALDVYAHAVAFQLTASAQRSPVRCETHASPVQGLSLLTPCLHSFFMPPQTW
eukprot:3396126-Amphidinium_carterae.1